MFSRPGQAFNSFFIVTSVQLETRMCDYPVQKTLACRMVATGSAIEVKFDKVIDAVTPVAKPRKISGARMGRWCR